MGIRKVYPGGSKGLYVGEKGFLPDQFFYEIVAPNVECFLQDVGSKQFAFNAVVGLYHMVDYIFEFSKKYKIKGVPGTLGEYRQTILEKCPEFHFIEAVALSYKHFNVENKRAKKIVSSIMDIRRSVVLKKFDNVRTGPSGDTIYGMDFTKDYEGEEEIMISTVSGEKRKLIEDCLVVTTMWAEELIRLDIDEKVFVAQNK